MTLPDRHQELRGEFHRIFQSDGLCEVELRDAVLDAFLATDNHVGAEDLRVRLAEQGLDLNLAKVEHFLNLFTAYGIAHRQHFEGLGDRWEHLHLGTHHDHMVCVRCGLILEFESQEIEGLQDQVAATHGFRPAHHRLVIYGVCAQCDALCAAGYPLGHAASGEVVLIQKIRGAAALARRLESMGLNAGSSVQVMQNDGDGPIILARGDTRLGLDREVASRVLVVPVCHPAGPHRRRGRHRGGRG